MRPILCGLVFLLTTFAVAQQQGEPRPSGPPYGTPPRLPEGQAPTQQMPPDQNAPPNSLSNHEAAQQIRQHLNSEPALHDSKIAVHVDKKSVVLNGTIQGEDLRDVALRIAHSYSGERQIIDKLKPRQQA